MPSSSPARACRRRSVAAFRRIRAADRAPTATAAAGRWDPEETRRATAEREERREEEPSSSRPAVRRRARAERVHPVERVHPAERAHPAERVHPVARPHPAERPQPVARRVLALRLHSTADCRPPARSPSGIARESSKPAPTCPTTTLSRAYTCSTRLALSTLRARSPPRTAKPGSGSIAWPPSGNPIWVRQTLDRST
jgi:hypothetical protein